MKMTALGERSLLQHAIMNWYLCLSNQEAISLEILFQSLCRYFPVQEEHQGNVIFSVSSLQRSMHVYRVETVIRSVRMQLKVSHSSVSAFQKDKNSCEESQHLTNTILHQPIQNRGSV